MKKNRLLAALAVLAMLAVPLLAVGCGDDDDDGGGDGDGAAQQLVVGSDIPFPPFEQGRAPNYTGFDIDLVNEIAERANLQVEYQDTAFDTIFRDLAQGKFDMVASATTITPERQQTVDFSDPYYEAQQALMVERGSDIQTVEDLAGVTVGAQDGTTGEAYANDETEAEEVRGYPEGPDAVNALRAGQVEAVIIDLPVAADALESPAGEDLSVAAEIPTMELYGFAFQRDDDQLREQVNDALAEIKDDGTLADIYQRYFATEPPDSVLEGTTQVQ